MNGFLTDFKNTWNKPNNNLAKLIIINVLVWITISLIGFFSAVSKSQGFYDAIFRNIALPREILEYVFKPWTLVTYFFVHQDFFHILFNMLIMYWFGILVQEYLGARKLTALYILGGLAGGLAYLILFNLTPLFSQGGSSMIGASASVYAIVVAAATFKPDYQMHLIFLGPVKIKYIALVYIFLSFLGTVGSNAGGNVAHLGGALIGYLFVKQMEKGNDWARPVYSVLNFFGNLFSKQPSMTVSHRQGGSSKKASGGRKGATSPGQADIDAILDKISESGYEKLTKEEKEILFKASQKNK